MRLVRRDESVLEVYLGRSILSLFQFLNATVDSLFEENISLWVVKLNIAEILKQLSRSRY